MTARRPRHLNFCTIALSLSLCACLDPDPYERANTAATFYHGPHDGMQIALTFDDGPNPPYTDQILALLAEYQAKATFFVVGDNVARYPHLAQRMIAEGHAIGNHTTNHRDLTGLTSAQVARELWLAERQIYAATGQRPRIFRPPYGTLSTKIAGELAQWGFLNVLWSTSGKDWRERQSDQIAERVANSTEPGAIVLLHDGDGATGGDRSQTVAALAILLPLFSTLGYEFVTVPTLLGIEAERHAHSQTKRITVSAVHLQQQDE